VNFKRTSENQARKKLRKNLVTLLTPSGQPKSRSPAKTFRSAAKSSTKKLVAHRNFWVDRQVVYRKVDRPPKLFGRRLGGRPKSWWTTWRAANFSVDDLAGYRKVGCPPKLFGCPLGVSKVSGNFRNFLRAWFSEVLLKFTFGHHFFSLFKHLKINFLLNFFKKFLSVFLKKRSNFFNFLITPTATLLPLRPVRIVYPERS